MSFNTNATATGTTDVPGSVLGVFWGSRQSSGRTVRYARAMRKVGYFRLPARIAATDLVTARTSLLGLTPLNPLTLHTPMAPQSNAFQPPTNSWRPLARSQGSTRREETHSGLIPNPVPGTRAETPAQPPEALVGGFGGGQGRCHSVPVGIPGTFDVGGWGWGGISDFLKIHLICG